MIFELKKIFFQTKHTAIVLPLLFSLLFPTSLYASAETKEPSIFKKSYNAVYRFVVDKNHEYLLAPLAAAVAAGSLCGPWCAGGGIALGAIDEVSMYFGITDRRYLTWGVFGLTTGHMVNPSMPSDIAGVALGILLPTGVLNDHGELIAPLVSAVSGDSMGFLASIVDELAISSDVTDKHYLTCFTAGEKIAAKLFGGFNPAVSNFVGALLGSLAASNEESISASLTAPIRTAKEVRDVYGKFMPPDQVDNIIEKQALALAGSFFGLKSLDLGREGIQQILTYNFERLDNLVGPAWGGYVSGLGHFAVFLFPCFVGKTVSYGIDRYFDAKLRHSFEDNIRPALFSDEALPRLSQDCDAKALIDNLDNDINTITRVGGGLITGTVSSAVNGVYGVGVLIVSSPNLLIYSALCQRALFFIANILWEQSSFYSDKIMALHSERATIVSRYMDPKNSKTIMAGGGTKGSMQAELSQLSKTSREYEETQAFWNSVNTQCWTMMSMIMPVLDQALVGYEVKQGRIPFARRGEIALASGKVSNLFFSLGRTGSVLTVEKSLDHINALDRKIHEPPDRSDQINRIYEGNQLIMQNLEVGLGGKTYVKVDDLKLDMGKVYVLTGSPGGGKSLLMTKINEVTGNHVSGTGNIYYPLVDGKKPNIVMVTQEMHFPLNSSLQKVIAWPDVVSDDPVLKDKQKEEMRLLLEELELGSDIVDQSGLDSVQNWDAILSPGQQRKIKLVSAITKNPDILILDETFDNVDQGTIAKAQKILKTRFPKALILVVDHNLKGDIGNHFYDKELKLDGKSKRITMQDAPCFVLQPCSQSERDHLVPMLGQPYISANLH